MNLAINDTLKTTKAPVSENAKSETPESLDNMFLSYIMSDKKENKKPILSLDQNINNTNNSNFTRPVFLSTKPAVIDGAETDKPQPIPPPSNKASSNTGNDIDFNPIAGGSAVKGGLYTLLFEYYREDYLHSSLHYKTNNDFYNLTDELKDPNSKFSKFVDDYSTKNNLQNFDRENITKIFESIKKVSEQTETKPNANSSFIWILLHNSNVRGGNSNLIESSDFRFASDYGNIDFPDLEEEKQAEANKSRKELLDYILKGTTTGIDEQAAERIDSIFFDKLKYDAWMRQPNGMKQLVGSTYKKITEALFLKKELPANFAESVMEKIEKLYKSIYGEGSKEASESN